jgi:hypothetical protein
MVVGKDDKTIIIALKNKNTTVFTMMEFTTS